MVKLKEIINESLKTDKTYSSHINPNKSKRKKHKVSIKGKPGIKEEKDKHFPSTKPVNKKVVAVPKPTNTDSFGELQ